MNNINNKTGCMMKDRKTETIAERELRNMTITSRKT